MTRTEVNHRLRGLTLRSAKDMLREVGITINRQFSGEYRVAFTGWYQKTEPSAYYAIDLQDAIDTGFAMGRSIEIATEVQREWSAD